MWDVPAMILAGLALFGVVMAVWITIFAYLADRRLEKHVREMRKLLVSRGEVPWL